MKCPKKKELILLYYNELSQNRIDLLKDHIRGCTACSQKYHEIEAFLSGIKADRLEPTGQDYKNVTEYIQSKVHLSTGITAIFDRIQDIFYTLRLQAFYQTKLVPVLAVLIIMLGVFSFINSKGTISSRTDLAILEIEMELSLEDHETSIFDLFDDELFLEDMTTIPERSILHSRWEGVRAKT
jgi:hypothetical protein